MCIEHIVHVNLIDVFMSVCGLTVTLNKCLKQNKIKPARSFFFTMVIQECFPYNNLQCLI